MAHQLQNTFSGPVIDNGLHIGPCTDCKNCTSEKKDFKNFLQCIEFMDLYSLYGRCITTFYHVMVHDSVDKMESTLWKTELRVPKDLDAICEIQWRRFRSGALVS